MAVTAGVTFATPYLTERLKLGDETLAKRVRGTLGLDTLSGSDVGLTFSFSEDRALTAVQSAFAFEAFQPHETVALTPQAQELWGCKELPVVVIEMKNYCRHYAQTGEVPLETALGALRSLAGRSFYLAFADDGKDSLRCLHAPVLAVQKYKLKGQRRPTHLRVALTPVLYRGVHPEVTGFRPKPKVLHARLAASSKGGRPPEAMLRLASWMLTLAKPATTVTERTLAERLRVRTLANGQPGKFRETLLRYFGTLKTLGLLEDFIPPGSEDRGKWRVKAALDLTRSKG